MSARPRDGRSRARRESPAVDLATYLESRYRAVDYARVRQNDPVRFVERFRGSDPREVEVVGLVASALAYGRVEVILAHVADLLDRMGSPLDYVLSLTPRRALRDFARFVHRFNDGRDVAFLLWALRSVLEKHGSLGSLVTAAMRPSDPDLAGALSALARELTSVDPRPVYGRSSLPQSARFLVADPATGSACKRLLMFARWMVRRPEAFDGIDFGVWRGVSPGRLILPLDTHTARLAGDLGLSARKAADLRLAREATARLALIDPDDPVRFDFALAHLGITDGCRHRRDPGLCPGCALDPVCRAR